jgi:mevalonate kinase
MLKESIYYSKILLFGEYGIIQDSMGLSIPYNDYKGKFIFAQEDNSNSKKSNLSLKKYLSHLIELQNENNLPCNLDLIKLSKDIDNGIYFDSSIPQGFGVGSSGALVAGVYDNYCINKIDSKSNLKNKEVLTLKNILGELESYFHGTSSGLDPLICYLNLPILIKSKDEVGTITIPESSEGKGAIFLLNTGTTGETQPLVQHFLERCKEEGFRKMLKDKFKKYNDASIKAFLQKDISPLMQNVKSLSKVLLEHFKPMIPKVYQKLWKEGLDSNAYYLKLCGSGGGGFVLGFTEDIDKAKLKLEAYPIDVIYKF